MLSPAPQKSAPVPQNPNCEQQEPAAQSALVLHSPKRATKLDDAALSGMAMEVAAKKPKRVTMDCCILKD